LNFAVPFATLHVYLIFFRYISENMALKSLPDTLNVGLSKKRCICSCALVWSTGRDFGRLFVFID